MASSSATRDRITIIDDNLDEATLFEQGCVEAGVQAQVHQESSGAGALAYARAVDSGEQPAPDLVLLDINMPGVDGFQVLRALRSLPVWDDIPIFMYSSSTSDRDQATADALGAFGYIGKPSSIEEYGEVAYALEPYLPHGGSSLSDLDETN